ncbi:hypothetical protein BH23CHL2_BH23CHL2_12430 [soil metagenome]
MRWMLILAVVFMLAACGGDAETTTEGTATSSTGEPTSAGALPTETPADGGDEAGRGMIVFTGAEAGEITDESSCSSGPDGEGLQLFTSLYDEAADRTWMLQIYVREYDGPGEYEIGNSLSSAGAVSFADSVVTLGSSGPDAETWGSTSENGGMIVVNSDELSGTVDSTLTVEDGSSEIQISGTWTCSAL